jgi:hypothetical protein
MGMGFPQGQVEAALAAYNGNEQAAVNYLLSSPR